MPTAPLPAEDPERLLTDAEVGRRLGVSVRTAKEYRYTGELAYVTVGNGTVKPRVRVKVADLNALIERRREPARHDARKSA